MSIHARRARNVAAFFLLGPLAFLFPAFRPWRLAAGAQPTSP